MAKKLTFKKETKYGNIKEEYNIIAKTDNGEVFLGYICSFRPGQYALPYIMFPRNRKGNPQYCKSIPTAKNKVQDWWDKFIESQR